MIRSKRKRRVEFHSNSTIILPNWKESNMNGTERSAESKNKRNQYQIKEIPQKEKPEIATKKLKSRAFESNMEEKIG